MMPNNWKHIKKEKAAELLSSDLTSGLPSEIAAVRLRAEGKNRIHRSKLSPSYALLRLFDDGAHIPMVFAVLMSVSFLPLLSGLLVLACYGAFLAFYTYFYIQSTVKRKRRSDAEKSPVTVLRDGQRISIRRDRIVRGDVLFLTAGEEVPCDCYVLECEDLLADESALKTGAHRIPKGTYASSEEDCLLYAGTTVTQGRARVLCIETGADTVIARQYQNSPYAMTESEPRLFKKMIALVRPLSYVISAYALVLLIIGILYGGSMIFFSFFTSALLIAAPMPLCLKGLLPIFCYFRTSDYTKLHPLYDTLSAEAIDRLPSVRYLIIDTERLDTNEQALRAFLTECSEKEMKPLFLHRGSTDSARRLVSCLEKASVCDGKLYGDKLPPSKQLFDSCSVLVSLSHVQKITLFAELASLKEKTLLLTSSPEDVQIARSTRLSLTATYSDCAGVIPFADLSLKGSALLLPKVIEEMKSYRVGMKRAFTYLFTSLALRMTLLFIGALCGIALLPPAAHVLIAYPFDLTVAIALWRDREGTARKLPLTADTFRSVRQYLRYLAPVIAAASALTVILILKALVFPSYEDSSIALSVWLSVQLSLLAYAFFIFGVRFKDKWLRYVLLFCLVMLPLGAIPFVCTVFGTSFHWLALPCGIIISGSFLLTSLITSYQQLY